MGTPQVTARSGAPARVPTKPPLPPALWALAQWPQSPQHKPAQMNWGLGRRQRFYPYHRLRLSGAGSISPDVTAEHTETAQETRGPPEVHRVVLLTLQVLHQRAGRTAGSGTAPHRWASPQPGGLGRWGAHFGGQRAQPRPHISLGSGERYEGAGGAQPHCPCAHLMGLGSSSSSAGTCHPPAPSACARLQRRWSARGAVQSSCSPYGSWHGDRGGFSLFWVLARRCHRWCPHSLGFSPSPATRGGDLGGDSPRMPPVILLLHWGPSGGLFAFWGSPGCLLLSSGGLPPPRDLVAGEDCREHTLGSFSGVLQIFRAVPTFVTAWQCLSLRGTGWVP